MIEMWQAFLLTGWGSQLCALAGLAMVLLAGLAPIRYAWLTFNRFMRHFNIRKHGWPPAHLDADGDPISIEKTEDVA